jgi:hypothetical protein
VPNGRNGLTAIDFAVECESLARVESRHSHQIFADVDFDAIDPYDARANQLKSLAAGVADIVLSIARQEKDLVIDQQLLKITEQLAQIG